MNGTVIGVLCVAAFLIILGIVLLTGHGSRFIAGYNTMKPEEQAKYDKKKLCRGTGIFVLIIAAICVIMGLAEAFCAKAAVDIMAKICVILVVLISVLWIILGNIFCKK